MAEQKLRVGMIGAGSWARRHLEAWSVNKDSEVIGIWNRTAERAETLAKEFEIPRVFEDSDSLIQSDDVDIISISMPHNLHHPLSMAAIKAGKHVFCEKPLAMDLREAKEMKEQAEKAGVKTGIQFGHRCDPMMIHLHDLGREGYLGDLQYIELMQCFNFGLLDERLPLTWRLRKSIAGAGALGDLGVYVIDLARWIVGEFSDVCATMKTFIKERPTISDKYNAYEIMQMAEDGNLPEPAETGIVDNDDECNMLVEFGSGVHGIIRTSRIYGDRSNKICGSRGEIRWNPEDGKLMGMIDEEKEFTEIPVPEVANGRTIVSQFVENIINNTDLPPTFFDGMKAQEVIEAALISIDEKRWVTLPIY